MEYNRKEALRYLGAQGNDKQAEDLVDLAYFHLRNQVQPRGLIKAFDCVVDQEGVKVAGIYFRSRDLARHLAGCSRVLALAATLGTGVDITIRRLALTSVAQGAAAQAVAAALIEAYCDKLQQQAPTEGLAQRPRFSPGYGDWPLEDQQSFFQLVDCSRKIGLTLTDGMMMAPSKSVTALIGLSQDVACVWNKCMTCGNINCPYREEK